MTDFLSRELREALRGADPSNRTRRTTLTVHAGRHVVPIRRLWQRGLAVDADSAPHLRGLVDIYDGPTHLGQCLIVAVGEEGGELICEFKRALSRPVDAPPRDFAPEEDVPQPILTGPTRAGL
ncbi:hypothetical protein SAMN04490244_109107 [Tranquillimonas rosea]|uniref:PilZ domain-containing protein n=1 Tax=Tranquillimonas rosea TaxID=641238 RepID=A0A1H9W5B1_9RHOB|nr:hypothetical protein [Tranquillimonas rosea]SES29150.1 hypothetical protein SAMN04490244_109107 [Tranquillimonas rosea]